MATKLTDKRRTILRALVLAPRPLTAANLSAMTYPYDVRAVRDELFRMSKPGLVRSTGSFGGATVWSIALAGLSALKEQETGE